MGGGHPKNMGDIVEEASLPVRDIVKEASAPVGDIFEEALTPVVATGKGRKRKGGKLSFSKALHPSVIIKDGGHTQSVQACTV